MHELADLSALHLLRRFDRFLEFRSFSAPGAGNWPHYTGGMLETPAANGDTGGSAAVSDRELLSEFVYRRDARAFETIVRRHGGMVYGVCRRLLRDPHACDDAFQATFLVLARSAGRIRKRHSLASWLHGVAHRISRRALAERYRRQEQTVPMEQVIAEPELRDVETRYEQQMLDAELQSLPERYREPLVLHYLEGLSSRELAERLGLSVSAVEGRLKRGRKELRMRLTRHGVELASVVLLLQAAQPAAAGALLESLITVAAKTGAAATAGTLPTHLSTSQAAALAGKELAMMTFSTKMAALMAASLAAVAFIGLSTGDSTRAGGRIDLSAHSTITTLAGLNQPADAEPMPQSSANAAPSTNIGVAAAVPDSVASESEPANSSFDSTIASGDYHVRDAQTFKIESALKSETTLEFPGNSLRDVIEYLSHAHEMPIILDETALSDQGISSDEEMSFVLSGVTLQNALELILENVAGVPLDYVVQNQVLKITTREVADQMLETRVYNVRDFSSEFDEVMLANVIRKSVQPRSWMNVTIEEALDPGMGDGMMPGSTGGLTGMPGGMGMYPAAIPGMTIHADSDGNGTIDTLPGCLIITQSQRIHREIVALLDQLRRHAASPQPEPATFQDSFNSTGDYPAGTPSNTPTSVDLRR